MRVSQVQKILLGMIFGILVGVVAREDAQPLEYIGTLFLHLIKMVTVPIIFFTIVYGTTNIESKKSLFTIGRKAMVVFLSTSIIAASLGIAVSEVLKPGCGVDISILKNKVHSDIRVSGVSEHPIELLVNIIPTNIFSAFADGNILQIIIFSFFVGSVLNAKRETCKDLINICHQSANIFFEMIRKIMYVAPFGVFGYMASMVGTQGVEIIATLGNLMLAILTASLLQYITFGILILLFVHVSPLPFYKKLLGVQIMAFSTSSSKVTLAHLMQVSENELGISQRSSGFLLPLSAALNMDGGAIYQASCAIFFAQMMGVSLSYMDYITLVFVSTIASIGGAGIPGGVLLFLGMVLQSIGLPIEGVVVIASIDRFLDMITTVINVTGDACVTLLIDNSEGTLDRKKYNSVFVRSITPVK